MTEYPSVFFLSGEGAPGTLRVRVITRAHIHPLGEGEPETLVEMLPMGVKCFAHRKKILKDGISEAVKRTRYALLGCDAGLVF